MMKRLSAAVVAATLGFFALGALKAAEFVLSAKPGLYSFEEVLTCGQRRS